MEVLIALLARSVLLAIVTMSVEVCFICLWYFGVILQFRKKALCGNGICQPEVREECVSCPLDCTNTTCGMGLPISNFSLNFQ